LTPFVLDASTTLSWHFKDEMTDHARALARLAFAGAVVVPQHWYLEVISGLIRGERRSRTSPDVMDAFLSQLEELVIDIHETENTRLREEVLPLARLHRLTIYDAVYVDLASRLNLPLATLDVSLGNAARAIGIALIEDFT
jgi:predicted nucleic acid-binding protein